SRFSCLTSGSKSWGRKQTSRALPPLSRTAFPTDDQDLIILRQHASSTTAAPTLSMNDSFRRAIKGVAGWNGAGGTVTAVTLPRRSLHARPAADPIFLFCQGIFSPC